MGAVWRPVAGSSPNDSCGVVAAELALGWASPLNVIRHAVVGRFHVRFEVVGVEHACLRRVQLLASDNASPMETEPFRLWAKRLMSLAEYEMYWSFVYP